MAINTKHIADPSCQCSRCFTDSCAVPRRTAPDYVTVEWHNGREGVAIAVTRLNEQLAAQGLAVVTQAEKDGLQDEVTRLTAALKTAEMQRNQAMELWAEQESRAEALQARVAELEDEEERLRAVLADVNAHALNKMRECYAAESELATAKARVAELEAELKHSERERGIEMSKWVDQSRRAHAAESELADLRGRVLLCQRRYAAGCSRESMAEALNEAVQTLVLVSKAEQSELEDLRGRVSRAITWLASARIAAYQHQKNDAVNNALAALRGEEMVK